MRRRLEVWEQQERERKAHRDQYIAKLRDVLGLGESLQTVWAGVLEHCRGDNPYDYDTLAWAAVSLALAMYTMADLSLDWAKTTLSQPDMVVMLKEL